MILLVGAGAVGTILTTYLLAGGREPLKVYVRDRDLSALQTVDAARVDHVTSGRPPLITGKPALTTSLDLDGVDYVMLCVKFPDLEGVLEQIGDIPEGCTLISTLNGVNSLRVIRERFPHARVVPMSVMFNGQRLGPLHARITTKPIVMAGTDDSRLLDMFGRSGMQVVGVAGEAAVWGKLLINLANALGAATHTTFKDLFTHPDLRACYVGVLDEAIAVLHAAGIGYKLPMPVGYGAYRFLLRNGGPILWWVARVKNGLEEGSYPSMVADIENGRTTEISQLNGEIVCLGERCGHPTPVNRALTEVILSMHGAPAKYLSPSALRQRLGLGPQ
mgnify:CR=1 FL=1|jgi:2-dehydropantoate 2-reductase